MFLSYELLKGIYSFLLLTLQSCHIFYGTPCKIILYTDKYAKFFHHNFCTFLTQKSCHILYGTPCKIILYTDMYAKFFHHNFCTFLTLQSCHILCGTPCTIILSTDKYAKFVHHNFCTPKLQNQLPKLNYVERSSSYKLNITKTEIIENVFLTNLARSSFKII